MDKAEALAEQYLKSCEFTSIVYEPDGNVPPDFLCEGSVAVEVRRLNQSFDNGNARRGLSETEIPLSQHIRKLLSTFGPPLQNHSWFVYYRFSRPLPKWRTLEPLIIRELQGFIANPVPFDRKLIPEFELKVFAASKVHGDYFILGGYSDGQSDGWVVGEMLENLKHGIAEKTRKIASYRNRYHTWWLVFVDLIAYGMDAFDQRALRKELNINHTFDKVIIIDPNDPRRSFEL
jgi:hypothetical protein